jgi:hypothetical protein
MRQVHARLDERSAAALEYLCDLLGCSDADAVRQGLRLYASTMKAVEGLPQTKQFAQAISGVGSKVVPFGVEQSASSIRPVEKVAQKAEQSAHELHDQYVEYDPLEHSAPQAGVLREGCGHINGGGECQACEALREVEA